MRVLFITNDAKDALISRVPLSVWLNKSTKIHMDIVSPDSILLKQCELNVLLSPERKRLAQRFFFYKSLPRSYDVVVLRGIDTILLGAIAFRKVKFKIFYLTGLGIIFNKSLFCGSIFRFLYRKVLKIYKFLSSAVIIVQNPDDKKDLNIRDIYVVNGSGLPYFIEKYEKSNKLINICTATRLTRSKGLDEILGLALEIKMSSMKISYTICGSIENLSTKHKEIIYHLNSDPRINFVGEIKDVSTYLKKTNIVFYPTKYREGVPRFLIESLMHGNIIITSNVPGARECLSGNGVFITSPKEVLRFLSNLNHSELNTMSKLSRQLYESKFHNDLVYRDFSNILIKTVENA